MSEDPLVEAKELADEMRFIVSPEEASPQSTMLEIKVYKWQLDLDRAIAAWEKERREEEPRWAQAVAIADKYRALRAAVEKVEGEMRQEAKMRMECENVAPDEYGYLIHQADALKSARLGEGVS